MEREIIAISQVAQLDMLLANDKEIRFVFDFPTLSRFQNQTWTTKIKKNYAACGCSTGARFMFLATLTAINVLLYRYLVQKEAISLLLSICSVVFIFSMAAFGKWVGIFTAERNLRKQVDQLKLIVSGNS